MGNARRVARWAATLTTLCAVLAAAACGGDGGTDDASPASTTEASEPADTTVAETTTTTLSPEAEVEAAVVAHDAMIIRLAQAPDPDDPEIAQRSTGSSRERAESGFAQMVALGQYGQPGPNMSISVLHTEVSGDHATVDACEVDDGLLIDAATGNVLDDDVVTSLVTISLERIDGQWLVSSSVIQDTWDGVTSCA